jgi:aminopeptidase YwaD
MLEHVRELSKVPRVGGTSSEKAAADYLAAQLRGYGYDVELQPFTIANESIRDSSFSVQGDQSDTIPSVPMQGSGAGAVRGALVSVSGLGERNDFPSTARGAIVLIERGDLTFRDKVSNAAAAGAVGVVIFNNEAGIYYGNLGENMALPTIAISQVEGRRLRDLITRGPAAAQLSVDVLTRSTSHNVIATPPGAQCETVSGGHYDSVPQAPGANDNASGTAVVLELANLFAATGRMGGNCFVLFGSEELGLLGSRHYVASLDGAARGRLKAMLNFDMVGVGTNSWQLIGTAHLQEKAAQLAESQGIESVRANTASTGAGSDHGSFLAAGIPAIFFHRTNDSAWHTPDDAVNRIQREHLDTVARLGISMLDWLNGGA